MNTYSKMLNGLLVILIVLFTSSCNVARPVVEEYHTLIEAYQNGQMSAANGQTCMAFAFAEIETQATFQNSYLVADIAKTAKYREALKEFGSKFSEQRAQYSTENGQPAQPDQLDLNQLVANKATPADMMLTINAYVTQFNEAPLAPVDPTVTLNTQRLVSEKYNMAYACVKDWNDSVKAYNIERNKIPGDAVGRIAEFLKVKELPQSLPYFTMTAPSAPPTVPTLAIPSIN